MLAGLGSFELSEIYSSEEEMLNVANRNLLSIDWFGIHENLEQSLSQLRQVCKDYRIELKVNPSNFT